MGWSTREQRTARRRAAQRPQLRRQILQLTPQLVDLVTQPLDVCAAVGELAAGRGHAVVRHGHVAEHNALAGAGTDGHGQQRDRHHEGAQTEVST